MKHLRSQFALLVYLLASAVFARAQQPGWTVTGSLITARAGHTATLLANGKILVVGGSATSSRSSELYDPATGRWTATGGLNSARTSTHRAVRLTDGRVLVVGGGSSEIYDPNSGAWSVVDNLRRGGATATLLADGRVLVTGGSESGNLAELYNPATGAWSQAGKDAAPLDAARLLPNGKVLFLGGSYSRSAELYDPATGSWTPTGNLITGRLWDYEAVLLPTGKVLAFGGGISGDDYCDGVDTSELYDPTSGQWSRTGSLILTHNDYYTDSDNATLLPDGKVLVVGGGSAGSCDSLKSAEVYDPVTGGWSITASMNVARGGGHTLTVLANGKVLVVGGDGAGASAELFDSGTPSVTSLSAAGFPAVRTLAPESIASAIGENLATSTLTAPPLAPPTELAGVSVRVRDRVGAERLAPLFYVSPGLINYEVPAGTAVGLATVTITSGGSLVAAGLVEIAGVAPGLFSANSSGQGVASGFWIRVSGGAQSYDYLFDLTTRKSAPLDLGPPGDQMYLSLYGTGFRSGTGATATVGGVDVPVYGFAPVTGYPGLDVVNIGPLPHSLAGRGEVDVVVSMDGKAANRVSVNIH